MSVNVALWAQLALPDFWLPAHTGKTIRLSDYRHAMPVVLILLPEENDASRECLRAFAAHYTAYRAWPAEVLAVIGGTQEQAAHLAESLTPPFPVLADAEGSVWEKYIGERKPALLILDRYNALHRMQIAANPADLMPPSEALDWIRHAEMACPECGVPEW